MAPISVLIVDDSAFMRKALESMLEKDPDIKVVGTAKNGEEGLELVKRLNPDVVTLDIEMPKMDGLTALRHIMMEAPRPVLMVSSLTNEGAEATLKALELGAVDFIPKQLSKVSLDIVKIEDSLRQKVKEIAKRRIFPGRFSRPAPKPAAQTSFARPAAEAARPAFQSRFAQSAGVAAASTPSQTAANGCVTMKAGKPVRDVVAIGVSTGGPPAVQKVLQALPKDFPAAILIAQHMPAAFTGPFAKRLDGVCQISVKEAENGERLVPGTAYIAPGGRHLAIEQRVSRIDVRVLDEPKEALYKPSANVLIESAALGVGRRCLGLVMTGMGSDGAEGVKVLKQKGGKAIAQSDATCVVYGMPKAVVDAGLADRVVDLDDIAQAVADMIFEP